MRTQFSAFRLVGQNKLEHLYVLVVDPIVIGLYAHNPFEHVRRKRQIDVNAVVVNRNSTIALVLAIICGNGGD